MSQLQGGIHRYLEEFPDGGKFLGVNFVFDSRVAMAPKDRATPCVGRCDVCAEPWERLDGNRVCTVCHDLVLVCDACDEVKREFWCGKHKNLTNLYHHHLEPFTEAQLQAQWDGLNALLKEAESKKHQKNLRHRKRTLRGKMDQVKARMELVKSGEAQPQPDMPRAPCRACDATDHEGGTCYGYWEAKAQREHYEKVQRLVDEHGEGSEAVAAERQKYAEGRQAVRERLEREAQERAKFKAEKKAQSEANHKYNIEAKKEKAIRVAKLLQEQRALNARMAQAGAQKQSA